MKTEELVRILAAGVAPSGSRRMWPDIALAAGWGGLLAMVLMLAFLGVRPDAAGAVSSFPFWMKLALPALLIVGCIAGLNKISRPGVPLKRFWLWLVVPVLLVWAMAAAELAGAAPGDVAGLIFGSTWRSCVASVALLSIPVLGAVLWALQRLAPTRPMVAGACSGLLAGAVGALVYALHCPESSASFLGVWYVSGMALPAIAGALLGSRLLRW